MDKKDKDYADGLVEQWRKKLYFTKFSDARRLALIKTFDAMQRRNDPDYPGLAEFHQRQSSPWQYNDFLKAVAFKNTSITDEDQNRAIQLVRSWISPSKDRYSGAFGDYYAGGDDRDYDIHDNDNHDAFDGSDLEGLTLLKRFDALKRRDDPDYRGLGKLGGFLNYLNYLDCLKTVVFNDSPMTDDDRESAVRLINRWRQQKQFKGSLEEGLAFLKRYDAAKRRSDPQYPGFEVFLNRKSYVAHPSYADWQRDVVYAERMERRYLHNMLTPPLRKAFKNGWTRGWDSIDGFPKNGAVEDKADFAWKQILHDCTVTDSPVVLNKIVSWLILRGVDKHADPDATPLKPEDLQTVEKYLEEFEQKKHLLPDRADGLDPQEISSYKTFEELKYAVSQDYYPPKDLSLDKILKEVTGRNAKKIWSSDDVALIHLRTRKGAKACGRDTDWCTAYNNNDNFNDYKRNLLLVWTKDNRRFQIHLDTMSCMNETDSEEDLAELINRHPGLDAALRPYVLDSIHHKGSDLKGNNMFGLMNKVPAYFDLFDDEEGELEAKIRQYITPEPYGETAQTKIKNFLQTFDRLLPAARPIITAVIKNRVIVEIANENYANDWCELLFDDNLVCRDLIAADGESLLRTALTSKRDDRYDYIVPLMQQRIKGSFALQDETTLPLAMGKALKYLGIQRHWDRNSEEYRIEYSDMVEDVIRDVVTSGDKTKIDQVGEFIGDYIVKACGPVEKRFAFIDGFNRPDWSDSATEAIPEMLKECHRVDLARDFTGAERRALSKDQFPAMARAYLKQVNDHFIDAHRGLSDDVLSRYMPEGMSERFLKARPFLHSYESFLDFFKREKSIHGERAKIGSEVMAAVCAAYVKEDASDSGQKMVQFLHTVVGNVDEARSVLEQLATDGVTFNPKGRGQGSRYVELLESDLWRNAVTEPVRDHIIASVMVDPDEKGLDLVRSLVAGDDKARAKLTECFSNVANGDDYLKARFIYAASQVPDFQDDVETELLVDYLEDAQQCDTANKNDPNSWYDGPRCLKRSWNIVRAVPQWKDRILKQASLQLRDAVTSLPEPVSYRAYY